MRSNKGFTLIELLAVIVVLAIIALIATPMVLNVINDAKKGALEQSANSVVQAVENKIALDMIKDSTTATVPTSVTETTGIEVKGDQPVCVNLTLEKGIVKSGTIKFATGTVTIENGQPKTSATKLETNADTATCTAA